MIIFYKALTGEPVSTLDANVEIYEYAIATRADDLSFIETHATLPRDFYIENNAVIETLKPSELHRFNFETKSWFELPPSIPKTVTMRQARLQLLNLGLLDDVETTISSFSRAAQIEWEYSTEVLRGNDLVQQLQSLLPLSDLEMDLFFLAASRLWFFFGMSKVCHCVFSVAAFYGSLWLSLFFCVV